MANVPSELPELQKLIPIAHGEIAEWFNTLYLIPTVGSVRELQQRTTEQQNHRLVRVGFKIYELHEWVDSRKGYRLRPFKCTLNADELARLAAGKSTRHDGG